MLSLEVCHVLTRSKTGHRLINATEEDGYTIIEMERPLETCDSQDDFTLTLSVVSKEEYYGVPVIVVQFAV